MSIDTVLEQFAGLHPYEKSLLGLLAMMGPTLPPERLAQCLLVLRLAWEGGSKPNANSVTEQAKSLVRRGLAQARANLCFSCHPDAIAPALDYVRASGQFEVLCKAVEKDDKYSDQPVCGPSGHPPRLPGRTRRALPVPRRCHARGRAQGAGGCVSGGGGRGVSHQPQGGWHRSEPDGGRLCDPYGSVVEPRRGRPGQRPRPPHRPDAPGHHLPAGDADTIEEKIVALHGTKRALADSLLEGADMAHKISAGDMLALLQDEWRSAQE